MQFDISVAAGPPRSPASLVLSAAHLPVLGALEDCHLQCLALRERDRSLGASPARFQPSDRQRIAHIPARAPGTSRVTAVPARKRTRQEIFQVLVAGSCRLRRMRSVGGFRRRDRQSNRSCGRSAPLASISPALNRRRFSLSLSRSLAAEMSLNFVSAFLSPGCRSGWNLRASFLRASLISLSVADRATPSVSIRIFHPIGPIFKPCHQNPMVSRLAGHSWPRRPCSPGSPIPHNSRTWTLVSFSGPPRQLAAAIGEQLSTARRAVEPATMPPLFMEPGWNIRGRGWQEEREAVGFSDRLLPVGASHSVHSRTRP